MEGQKRDPRALPTNSIVRQGDFLAEAGFPFFPRPLPRLILPAIKLFPLFPIMVFSRPRDVKCRNVGMAKYRQAFMLLMHLGSWGICLLITVKI